MANKLKITVRETADRMADSLIDKAASANKSLAGISVDNFNTFLDNLFKDGGEIRCENFADLAWDYSLQFGELGSDNFDNAQWRCIRSAIIQVRKRIKTRSKGT